MIHGFCDPYLKVKKHEEQLSAEKQKTVTSLEKDSALDGELEKLRSDRQNLETSLVKSKTEIETLKSEYQTALNKSEECLRQSEHSHQTNRLSHELI